MIVKTKKPSPVLMTRNAASEFLGIDTKSFDRYFRRSDDLPRFMIGSKERYLASDLLDFIRQHRV